jgi:hypothetical protein
VAMKYESLDFLDSLIQAVESGWPVSLKSLLTLRALTVLDVRIDPPPIPLPHPAEIDE